MSELSRKAAAINCPNEVPVWQIWDAVIISVCDAHGVSTLFTEDMQDGQRIGGLKIVNPFNPANAYEVAAYLFT